MFRDPKESLLGATRPKLTDSGRAPSGTSFGLFLSRKTVTFTGAAVEKTVPLVTGAIGLVDNDDFEVAGVDSDGAFEDFCDWDCASEIPVKDEAVGDWMRDDGLERRTGELDAPLVSLARLDIEALNDGVIVLGLFVTPALSLALSSLLCDAGILSFPPPTASLNRVYSPLKPFCINSPVMPLVSVPEEEVGGDANSLKVVRLSEWQAVLCIASRAWAS